MSIMPQDPSSKQSHLPTLDGVSDAMLETGDRLITEIALLIGAIGRHHGETITCAQCRDGEFLPCEMLEGANGIAIAWLMQRAGI